jgi:hypothetical protein
MATVRRGRLAAEVVQHGRLGQGPQSVAENRM